MSLVPGLHDATVEGIELDWRSGSVRIAFGLGVDGTVPVIHKADGLTNFACPRQSPWGPSDSVIEVTAKIMDAGQQVLIEMQSGDQIEILCEKVAIVEISGSDIDHCYAATSIFTSSVETLGTGCPVLFI